MTDKEFEKEEPIKEELLKEEPINEDPLKENLVSDEKVEEAPQELKGNPPTPGQDFLMGLGISIVAYGLIMLTFMTGLPMTFVSLFSLLVLSVMAVLIVKFFRMKRTNAAVIMLIFFAPSVLFLLLVGSCALVIMNV